MNVLKQIIKASRKSVKWQNLFSICTGLDCIFKMRKNVSMIHSSNFTTLVVENILLKLEKRERSKIVIVGKLHHAAHTNDVKLNLAITK